MGVVVEAIRTELLELLRGCGVFALDDQGIDQAFIRGECDIALESLEMDSLAIMEVCIALENTYGISITPKDLPTLTSLKALVDRIQEVS